MSAIAGLADVALDKFVSFCSSLSEDLERHSPFGWETMDIFLVKKGIIILQDSNGTSKKTIVYVRRII